MPKEIISKLEKENIRLKKKIREQDLIIKELLLSARNHKKSSEFDFLTKITNRMSFTVMSKN